MSRNDWLFTISILLGLVLFLYGANAYNPIVGWLGVILFVGGFLALVGLYIYNMLSKPEQTEEAAEEEKEVD